MPRRGVRGVPAKARIPTITEPPEPIVKKDRPRVIVSMTTIPSRIELLAPVIWPLFSRQTVKPDVLVLHIPHQYRDPKLGTVGNVPSILQRIMQRESRIVVNRQCQDLGPGTKVAGLHTLAWIQNDDLIIYVDDDVAHDRNMIARHVEAHMLFKKHVFCCRGSTLKTDLNNFDRAAVHSPPMLPIDVPEGCGSVSVKYGDAKIGAFVKTLRQCRDDPCLFFSDDVLLGNHYWEIGLTVRLLPSPIAICGLLPFAHDAMSLMNGRDGALDDTRTRMLKAVDVLKSKSRCYLPGFDVQYRKFHHLKDWRRATLGMIGLDRVDPVPLPPDDTRTTAFVVFAFNRPKYLERVLLSLKKNGNAFQPEHTYVFIDGMLNAKSGALRGEPDDVQQSIAVARSVLGPTAHIWTGACNYGVGLMQFYGMWRVFNELRYTNAIFLEDDLVLGRHYLATVLKMLPVLQQCPHLSSIQGGYRRWSEDPDEVRVVDARGQHVHYWGWLTTRDRFNKIFKRYSEAVNELFVGVDYKRRNDRSIDHVGDWFRKNGLSADHRSQDWVRDACFRLEGMSYKIECACRRAAPIGLHGLHSSPAVFKRLGLDDTTNDIDSPRALDPSVAYRLCLPIKIRADVPKAMADLFVQDSRQTPRAVMASNILPAVQTNRAAIIVITNPDDMSVLKDREPHNTWLLVPPDVWTPPSFSKTVVRLDQPIPISLAEAINAATVVDKQAPTVAEQKRAVANSTSRPKAPPPQRPNPTPPKQRPPPKQQRPKPAPLPVRSKPLPNLITGHPKNVTTPPSSPSPPPPSYQRRHASGTPLRLGIRRGLRKG